MFNRIGFLLLSVTLSGCCFIDYSDSVQELADQYKLKVIEFYQQNERYPDKRELDVIIISLGCKISSLAPFRYRCNSNEFQIGGGFSDPPNELATLKLVRSNTICFYRFHKSKDGKSDIDKVECLQTDCIDLRQ